MPVTRCVPRPVRRSPRARRLAGALGISAAVAAGALGAAAVPAGAAGGPNARHLMAAAVAAARHARSATISGTLHQGGDTVSLHLVATRSGNGAGTVSLDGQTLHIVVVNKVSYLRAGSKFWATYTGGGSTGVAGLLANRWIKSPYSKTSGLSFTQFTSPAALFSSSTLTSPGVTLTLAGRATFGGHPVYVVQGTEHHAKGKGTVLVAASGTPYPLELKAPNGGGTMVLSNWNRPVHVVAPAGAVDLSKLTGRG